DIDKGAVPVPRGRLRRPHPLVKNEVVALVRHVNVDPLDQHILRKARERLVKIIEDLPLGVGSDGEGAQVDLDPLSCPRGVRRWEPAAKATVLDGGTLTSPW